MVKIHRKEGQVFRVGKLILSPAVTITRCASNLSPPSSKQRYKIYFCKIYNAFISTGFYWSPIIFHVGQSLVSRGLTVVELIQIATAPKTCPAADERSVDGGRRTTRGTLKNITSSLILASVHLCSAKKLQRSLGCRIIEDNRLKDRSFAR